MQQTSQIPGYTGFKPSQEPFMSAAYKKETGGNKIPGKSQIKGLNLIRLRWIRARNQVRERVWRIIWKD